MTRISMLIPPDELADIDEVAVPNRTAFMLRVVKEAVARLKQERLQNEISACLLETADEDLELTEEFSATAADGL
jgi:hypothetical protein